MQALMRLLMRVVLSVSAAMAGFERLVDDAESDRELRWMLRYCLS